MKLFIVEDSVLVRQMFRERFPTIPRVEIVGGAASVAAGANRFILKSRLHDELPGAIAQLFPGHAGGAEEERP